MNQKQQILKSKCQDSSQDSDNEKDQSHILQNKKKKVKEKINQIPFKIRSLDEMFRELTNNGIQIKLQENHMESTKYQSEFIFNKIHYSANFEIVTITVTIGWYTQQLKILNLKTPSLQYQTKIPIALNSMIRTSIYRLIHQQQSIIAKCINFEFQSFKNTKTKQKKRVTKSKNITEQQNLNCQHEKLNINNFILIQTIQEYCIAKILSILQLGPKVINLFGFDLIISQTLIQMYFQDCLSHQKVKGLQNYQEIYNDLTIRLKQMHQLSIVHRDIKPDNIMYSLQYKKMVFIDFGVSQFFNQHNGRTAKDIEIKGTIKYWNQQMKMLFNSKSKDYEVDLFSNDQHGLSQSIKQIKTKKITQKKYQQNDNKIQIPLQTLLVLKSKYLISINIPSEVIQLFQQIPDSMFDKQKLKIELFSFLYEVNPSQQIRQFYQTFFQKNIRQQGTHDNLKKMYGGPIIVFSEFILSSNWRFINKQDIINYQFYQNLYKPLLIFINRKNILSTQFRKQDSKKHILLDQNVKYRLSQTQYYDILLNFVSFRNINQIYSTEIKLKVCLNYCKLNNVSIINFKNPLEVINLTLLNVLQFYLKTIHPFPNQMIIIIEQLILIGVKVRQVQYKILDVAEYICASILKYQDKCFYMLKILYARKWLYYRSNKSAYEKYIQIDKKIKNKIADLPDSKLNQKQYNLKAFYLQFFQQIQQVQNNQRITVLQNLLQKLKSKDINISLQQNRYIRLRISFQIGKYHYQYGNFKLFQSIQIQNIRKSMENDKLSIEIFNLMLIYAQFKDSYNFRKTKDFVQKVINEKQISQNFLISQNIMYLSSIGAYKQVFSRCNSYIFQKSMKNQNQCYFQLCNIGQTLSRIQKQNIFHYDSSQFQEYKPQFRSLYKKFQAFLINLYQNYVQNQPIMWRCSLVTIKIKILRCIVNSEVYLSDFSYFDKQEKSKFSQLLSAIPIEDFLPYDYHFKFMMDLERIFKVQKNSQKAHNFCFVENKKYFQNLSKIQIYEIGFFFGFFFALCSTRVAGQQFYYKQYLFKSQQDISMNFQKYMHIPLGVKFSIQSYFKYQQYKKLLNFLETMSHIFKKYCSNYNILVFIDYLNYFFQMNQKFNASTQVLSLLCQKLSESSKLDGQNYFCFIYLYFFQRFQNFEVKQKILKLLISVVDKLNFFGKKIIYTKIFYYQYLMIKTNQYRKRVYYIKKHLKYCRTKTNISIILLKLKIYNTNSYHFQLIRKKLMKLYENCQNLKNQDTRGNN